MELRIDNTRLRECRAGDFLQGHPFPLLVLDEFLPTAFADALLDEIVHLQLRDKSNDYVFARNKFEDPRLEKLGPFGRAYRDFVLSPPFAAVLSQMYGAPVFIDPGFIGGGVHRGGAGSYLDMHADFNLHPVNNTWIRELNLLLYLNKRWKPEYGGCLDLRNSHSGETACVEPLYNRFVIMLTKDFTFHGYRRISFPEGSFRTSVAAYAYSQAASGLDVAGLRTTTTWAPEEGMLKKMLARLTPSIVALKQRLFGSRTARRD